LKNIEFCLWKFNWDKRPEDSNNAVLFFDVKLLWNSANKV